MLLVSDDLYYYAAIIGLAALFSVLPFVLIRSNGTIALQGKNEDDNDDEEAFFRFGRIMKQIGVMLFLFLATGFWFILGYLTLALNNCSDTFGACFTSPTYASTTVTITQPWWGTVGGYIFYLMGIVYAVVTIMAILALLYSHFSTMDFMLKREKEY